MSIYCNSNIVQLVVSFQHLQMKNYLTLVKICKTFLKQKKPFVGTKMTTQACRMKEEIDFEYKKEKKAQQSSELESQKEKNMKIRLPWAVKMSEILNSI